MKKVLTNIIIVIMSGFFMVTPVIVEATTVYAVEEGKTTDDKSSTGEGNSCGGVPTAIIKCDSGSEKGKSIKEILQNVVNFLSVGIGILGTIGVTVVGIQYLTAGGNEEQTRKAKRRMLEIVIGLVAYFLMFGILNWLGVINNPK